MKSKTYKLLSVVLALAMIFSTLTCAITTVSAAVTVSPTMVQGTIDNKAGEIKPDVSTRIYTQALFAISDYEKVSVASGYKAYYHFYNASGNWMASSNKWVYGNVTATDLYGMSYGASHFRVAIGTNGDADLSPESFPTNALTMTKAPQPETLVTVKPDMAQGTIDNAAGEVKVGVSTRLYTKNYLLISDYAKVSVAPGYKAYYHLYNADGKWISHSGQWVYGDVTSAQLRAMSYYATYFAVVIGRANDKDIFLKDYTGEALTLYLASGLKEPTVSDVPIPDNSATPDLPADPNTTLPVMTQGTIDSKGGTVIPTSTNRVYTEELISVEDYEMVKIAKGYKGWFHCYDKDGNWLTSFGWQEAKDADLDEPVSALQAHSMDTAYFKVVIAKLDDSNLTPENFADYGLRLIRDVERYSDFTFENVFRIGSANYGGPWQEGAIFDGKLFMLNHDELGGVFDMETGEMIGDFICERDDFLSVHSNSICFGTEYYDKNDKYPLMYICVYNNYEGQANQYEGHCGVYRITEDGSDFKGDLVQVIKIGFTEDMNMWKSLPNRGDVCPFGNFIVDTDKNDLYAYVMRDGTQTTRYYKFDLPKVSDGEYNSLFGCKTVTLNVEDIKDQFDTEYSVYLQGADYVDGMILSSSGLGHGRDGGAILRLVDLETKKVIKTFDAMSAGVYNEPEVIAVDPDTKKVYYGSTDGQLRYLTCIDPYINRTEQEEHEHTYSEEYSHDGANHWFKCTTCDDKKDVLPHEYTNACDTECNVCKATREITHNFEWVIDQEASCGKNGTKHEECTVCHIKQKENTSVEATGNHDYESATCKAPKTCKVCSATVGTKLEHSYTNNCDIDCNLCSEIRTVGVHVYDNACDTECNACGQLRAVGEHKYDDSFDKDCNECGFERAVNTEPVLIKGDDGVWRYFVNGEWDQTATTLHKLNGKWFYVEDGIWSKASRLVEYKGVIFYVKGGKWDKTLADTLYKIEGNWYYIVDGKLAVDQTTLVKYKSKWFYVEEGELSLTSRFVNYKGVIFYIKGGKWDKTLNTLIKKDGKYVAVKSGKKYIGKAIIEYKGKKFYVNKGYAQLSYSGKVTIDGKKYTVKGGKIV